MKRIKTLLLSGLLVLLLTSFSKCSTSKNISAANMKQAETNVQNEFQTDTPLEMGKIEYRKWTSGIQGGGSGIHMYITVISNRNNIQLDSVHFQGMRAKINIGKMGYYAGFIRPENQKDTSTMSDETYGEYGNSAPKVSLVSHFEIENDECVISYLKKDQITYFKLENLIEKPEELYPSSPPKD